MNKKYFVIIGIIIVVIIIIVFTYQILNKEEKIELNDEFKYYSINDINITSSNCNFIFLDELDGLGKEELKVKVGDVYSFNKYGKHTIKVLKLTDDYITLSIKGLAPSKLAGGFSLFQDYEEVTINKGSGICLNVQATDLIDGSVYFFFV